MTIIPTILAKDFRDFQAKLEYFAPHFKLIQIDCADGLFVKNKTYYNLEKILSLPTSSSYELHLMIQNPWPIIRKYADHPKIKNIILHFETLEPPFQLAIKKFSLAINPETKLTEVLPILTYFKSILIMGVRPGRSGQTILPTTFERIKALRKVNKTIKIEVDGGVNNLTIKKLRTAGANNFAIGSYLLEEQDLKRAIKELTK